MGTVVNPHDKFFRELFTDREKAKNFLISFLPKDIAKLVDLDHIEIVKDSFILDSPVYRLIS